VAEVMEHRPAMKICPAMSINAVMESAKQLCAWHVDALNQNRRLAVREIATELVVRPAVGPLGGAAQPGELVAAPEAVMGAVKAKLVWQ
jgi:hypothetical protein